MTTWTPILRDGNARLSAELRDAGRSVWSADVGERRLEVLDLTVSAEYDIPEYVADTFGTARVFVRDRVYAVDGRRVQWARSYLPADLVEGTVIGALDTGPGGVPARLAELGHAPARFVEEVQFALPDAREQAKLAIGAWEPVVHIDRLAVTATGVVVEVAEMVLVNSAYRFRWAFEA